MFDSSTITLYYDDQTKKNEMGGACRTNGINTVTWLSDYRRGFGLVIGFIELLLNIATSKYSEGKAIPVTGREDP
jgi:hypothetical protein